MADISSTLHRHHHADYEEAKRQILQAIGDISDEDLFGRQVLVAVYVRPELNPVTGLVSTMTTLKEDWWQGKIVMVLKLGPDAFGQVTGEDSYFKATFGDKPPPQPGEWLMMNANAGLQTSFYGKGAARPKGKDRHGEMVDLYDWDGWPCRIVPDDSFLMRISTPHTVV